MQKEMTVRICATCDKPLNFKPDGTQEGIYCCDEYYHEGDCIEQSFKGATHSAWSVIDDARAWGCTDCDFTTTSHAEAIEHYKMPLTWEQHYSDDGDCYCTEWEPEYLTNEEI